MPALICQEETSVRRPTSEELLQQLGESCPSNFRLLEPSSFVPRWNFEYAARRQLLTPRHLPTIMQDMKSPRMSLTDGEEVSFQSTITRRSLSLAISSLISG